MKEGMGFNFFGRVERARGRTPAITGLHPMTVSFYTAGTFFPLVSSTHMSASSLDNVKFTGLAKKLLNIG